MGRKSKFDSAFKTKVVLDALKEKETLSERINGLNLSIHASSSGTESSPLSDIDRRNAGITSDTIDGNSTSMITPAAVITPLFHSMIVVTSPIGENAPPEFAAMITSAA